MYIITFTTSHILLTVISETSTADQFLHRSEKFSTINKSFKFSHEINCKRITVKES